jgi:hypothetical protein
MKKDDGGGGDEGRCKVKEGMNKNEGGCGMKTDEHLPIG